MAKKYTFKVTATLCKGDEDVTREQALESLREWLEGLEDDSGLIGSSEFDKIEIV